jgi:DNA-binding NtrC family response regulator
MFTDECSNAGDERETDPQRSAVLIVEDEHVARRALGSLLKASGYYTSAAESAEEALRLLQNQPTPPRIALVDLNLPGMNGIDFISRLEQIAPTVHAVLMTGAGDESLAQALQERYVPYVRKPLDFSRLLTLIDTPPRRQ